MLEILRNIGLSEGEILVYEALLNNGELSAGQIIERTKLKRGDCYNKIYDLVEKGLAEEFHKNKKKFFRLEHPNTIQEYVERRQNELEATRKEMSAILPGLVSTFNLAYHKPGVKYFEGVDSILKITADSLTAQEVIYSYVDPEGVDKYVNSEINRKYIREREKMGIKKYILAEDNLSNRARYENMKYIHAEIRYLPKTMPRFNTTMQIYDNKITFQTFKPESAIGIIVEDPWIYKLQRGLFECLWAVASI